MSSQGDAFSQNAGPQILDQGYRRYDGERLGMSASVRSLYVASIQRALGLKRPFRFKIVPMLTAVIAYLPAIVFVGIAVIFPAEFGDFGRVEYSDYGYITLATILFVAFIGPEVVITDRRTGLLGMYLAAPLTRSTYMLAKLASVITVLLVVTIGPPLLLLVGYTAIGAGPDGFGDFLLVLARTLVSGLMLSFYFAGIGVAISSLSKRNGFASAAIVLLFLGSTILSTVLTENTDIGGWVQLFDLWNLPFDTVTRIFGDPPNWSEVSTPLSYVAVTTVILVALAITWTRTIRATVTR